MNAGRKSAFTVYDEGLYTRFKIMLLEQNKDMSHYIWDLIKNHVEEYDNNIINLESFTEQVPRITDSFESIMKYVQKQSDSLPLIRDNGRKTQLYAMGCMNIPLEQRKIMKIDFDLATSKIKERFV